MKTITIGNNIIEECTLKEIMNVIMDNYINNMEYISKDTSLYIEYKDGTYYHICDGEIYGNTKFKKTNIKRVIEDNGSTYMVYGEYTPRYEDECLFID